MLQIYRVMRCNKYAKEIKTTRLTGSFDFESLPYAAFCFLDTHYLSKFENSSIVPINSATSSDGCSGYTIPQGSV